MAIADTGFIVSTGDELEPVIPRRADGRWDVEALRTRLEVLKAAHPSERRVFVAAGHDTAYETLVETLDATRETVDRRPLFPEVTLAGL